MEKEKEKESLLEKIARKKQCLNFSRPRKVENFLKKIRFIYLIDD
jgi:hypothetical protein